MSKFHYFFCIILMGFGITSKAQNNHQNTLSLIQPPFLKTGDTIAIVAPAGILKNREDEIQKAIALLKSWGLNAKIGKHVFAQAKHFAGTDEQRCEDFQKALDNPNIKAIWAARGGYGTVRILDKLDFSKFKKNPKWIIGYSDITALHSHIHNLGIETLHAMMCSSLGDPEEKIKETISSFKKALFGEALNYTLKPSKYNKVGTATGQLVGGNLTLLHTLLGSSSSIDTSGKILFIEEIGEYKYHIDRMLQSLKRAGYFDHCKAVIVGDMTKIRKNPTVWGSSIQQLILDALSDYDFPIVFGMPAGHAPDNRAVILGKKIQLTVSIKQSSIKFLN